MFVSIALNQVDRKKLAEDIKGYRYKEAIQLMLSKKYQKSGNHDLYGGLLDLGVDDEYAYYLVGKFGDYAAEMKEQAIKTIKYSIILMALGVIGFCIALATGRYIGSICILILAGTGQLIVFLIRKRQYEKVLTIIQQEKALRDKQQ